MKTQRGLFCPSVAIVGLLPFLLWSQTGIAADKNEVECKTDYLLSSYYGEDA